MGKKRSKKRRGGGEEDVFADGKMDELGKWNRPTTRASFQLFSLGGFCLIKLQTKEK